MLWIKAFHLIAMVTWFAGLFYLPRLFVYHEMARDTISLERFKIMERRLYYGIMTPGAVITLTFGIGLLYLYGWDFLIASDWLQIKLALVFLLIAYHLYCGKLLKNFAKDSNKHGHVYYRWMNEIPVILLIGIILLAILKPQQLW